MAREIFVDTGAWLALSDKRDLNHLDATRTYGAGLRRRVFQVTTNLVVAEAYVLIHRRCGFAPPMQFLESMHTIPRFAIIYSDAVLEQKAVDLLRRYSDQDFSFADAVSFAVMRERGIGEAFAFDHHFEVAGFNRL